MTSDVPLIRTVGIVGGGVVGKATARSMMEYTEVKVFDINYQLRTHTLSEVLGCDLIFVCLPTPKLKSSLKCDTSIIDGFFNGLEHRFSNAPFVLRSTVPIGYTKSLSYRFPAIIHNPEFLTARCSLVDAQLPSRHVIGSNPSPLSSTPTEDKLIKLYQTRFNGTPIHLMTTNESEAVKLFQNGYFAVTVSWWNECNELATKLGLNWDTIMAAILADGRIAHSHTRVPGPDGKYGFGGECLPKDLSSLISIITENGLKSSVGLGALIRNTDDRRR